MQVKSKKGTVSFHCMESEPDAIKASKYWNGVPGFSACFWDM